MKFGVPVGTVVLVVDVEVVLVLVVDVEVVLVLVVDVEVVVPWVVVVVVGAWVVVVVVGASVVVVVAGAWQLVAAHPALDGCLDATLAADTWQTRQFPASMAGIDAVWHAEQFDG